MTTMKRWKARGGLRKVCGCQPRHWAKCGHEGHINCTINGQHVRRSLAKITAKSIASKSDADASFEEFKVQVRKAPTVSPDAPLTPPMTRRRMLEAYPPKH